MIGIKESARVNTVMVAIKLVRRRARHRRRRVLRQPRELTPFIPPNTGAFGEFGWSGVMRGAA